MTANYRPFEIGFHLALTEEDWDLLDDLARRMGCSRIEAISRSLHILDAAQKEERATHAHERQH